MFLNRPKVEPRTTDPATMNEIAAAHASPGMKLLAGGCIVGSTAILLGFGYFHLKDDSVKDDAATPAVQTLPAKLTIPYFPREAAPAPPAPQVQPQQTAYPPGMTDQAPQAQQFAPQQGGNGNGEAQQAASAQKSAADAIKARRLSAGFGNEAQQAHAAVPPQDDDAPPDQSGQPAPSAAPSAAPPAARTGLAAMLVPSDTPMTVAGFIANPHMTMTRGTGIPCTLNTAIDTEQSGFGFCVTAYDAKSMDGSMVLMETGTKIDFEYARGMAHGQKSVFVLFTRAITPTNRKINLLSPGTDPLGRSGLAGKVNTKFWDRYGGALMFAVLQDGLAVASRSGSNGGNTQINLGNTQATGTTAAGEILTQNRDVTASMEIKHGTSVGITLARDLDFSTVYGLRLKDPK